MISGGQRPGWLGRGGGGVTVVDEAVLIRAVDVLNTCYERQKLDKTTAYVLYQMTQICLLFWVTYMYQHKIMSVIR